MTTPFWCLFIVALLPFVWSFAAAAERKRQLGAIDNKYPRLQQAKLEGLGARLMGAHQNAWEALALFTPAVAVSHLAGAEPGRAAMLSLVFVAARVAHGAAYAANLDLVRSAAFLVALGCVIWLFLLGG